MKQILIPASLALVLFSYLIIPRAEAQGCTFESQAYLDGQVVCQYGAQMKCAGGSWIQTGNECATSDAEENVRQPNAAGSGGVQMPAAPQAPAEPAVPPATD